MRAMTGDEIRLGVRGRWRTHTQPIPVRGVSIDSRTASEGDLFVAIRGEHHDGHDHLQAASEAGCIAAVIDTQATVDSACLDLFPVGVIEVADTREALLSLARSYRDQLGATVVGITGSNGKTTVKQMIHHILSKRMVGTASPKSYNNEIGVPLTLLSASAGDDYVLVEIGTNAPGEIGRLTRMARPSLSVITSISEAHLERLGDLEQIAAEKAAILGWLPDRGMAIITTDSPELDRCIHLPPERIIRVGYSEGGHLRLTDYEPQPDGCRFQINDREWVSLPVAGRHNAYNALMAIAVAARMGFTQEDASDAMADFPGVDMRLERIDAGSMTILNDAYNANPASMIAGVAVLADTVASRRVVVAGDMLEMGDRAAEIHRRVGQQVASADIDLVIGVGELGSALATAAGEAGRASACFASVDQAIEGLGDCLSAGDCVLLKASRGMGLEALVDPIRRLGGEAVR